MLIATNIFVIDVLHSHTILLFQSDWAPVRTDIGHTPSQLERLEIPLVRCLLVAGWTQQSNLL